MSNKALKIGDKLIMANDPNIIELDVSGTSFPDRQAATTFSFTGFGSNEMYVDWADGSAIETFVFTNNFAPSINTILHYYQDLFNTAKIGTVDELYSQRRVIKIRFKFPERINGVTLVNMNLYGKFPSGFGNYNLSSQLRINASRYINEFPTSFRGINSATLQLSDIAINTVTSLPEWIYNSRIKTLLLNTGFSFAGIPTLTNLDKLVNVVGLEQVRLPGVSNVSIPTNFKDIATLRILGLGQSSFTALQSNVSLISQLTSLIVSSADGYGYNNSFSNWGDGIGLMTNLNRLDYINCFVNTLPTTIPTGGGNCLKLKDIKCGGSYRSVARTDEHITAWYNVVTANGDIVVTANQNFRNVAFSIYFQTANSFRPSGSYQQPAGFVLGSNNGTTASVMEMIWVLVHQYKWSITIINATGNGSQILS